MLKLVTDTFTVIADIVRTEGVRRLYRGISTCLVRAVPSSGVLFGSYQYSFDVISAWSRQARD
jgi:hypothetical protein